MHKGPAPRALDQTRKGSSVLLARPLQVAYPIEQPASFSPEIAQLMQQLCKDDDDEG